MKSTDRFEVSGAWCHIGQTRVPISNLSVGGFFVAGVPPPLPGQELQFQLELPGRAPFAVQGRVSWVNDPRQRQASRLPAGFGVKITRIQFPDKLALIDAIKRAGLPASLRERS